MIVTMSNIFDYQNPNMIQGHFKVHTDFSLS